MHAGNITAREIERVERRESRTNRVCHVSSKASLEKSRYMGHIPSRGHFIDERVPLYEFRDKGYICFGLFVFQLIVPTFLFGKSHIDHGRARSKNKNRRLFTSAATSRHDTCQMKGAAPDLSAATYQIFDESHTMGNALRWMIMKK